MVTWARRVLERLLQAVAMALMVALTGVVVVAVAFRFAGDSLSWYDEVASIQLAWLTYYGAALAAYKRAHIGFPGLLEALPARPRLALFWFGELAVAAFFVLLAWVGMTVLQVLEGDTLVSLPWVPVQVTQSVIPIGAALFLLGQAISLPEQLRRVRAGRLLHEGEVAEEGR